MEYKKEFIKGYEEYQVDTNGIIYGKNGNPLHFSTNHKGYQIVNFMVNHKRKGFSVHTLVANQFLQKNKDKTQVNHKDGNKKNNCVDNLEWVTPSENMRHSVDILGLRIGAQNCNAKRIRGINKLDKSVISFGSIADCARYFASRDNLNFQYVKNSIWRVLKGIRKTYKNYYWEYY